MNAYEVDMYSPCSREMRRHVRYETFHDVAVVGISQQGLVVDPNLNGGILFIDSGRSMPAILSHIVQVGDSCNK